MLALLDMGADIELDIGAIELLLAALLPFSLVPQAASAKLAAAASPIPAIRTVFTTITPFWNLAAVERYSERWWPRIGVISRKM
ncbi:hypothetical protein [Amycolatopsis acididurans]|uniref:hypothetical protein n=1 Tax=Amycolatopsis acididurans TaxID=2724524 RepID=UPI001FE627AC|nr:hypothetical protein [Amycolatopsis acididurans]